MNPPNHLVPCLVKLHQHGVTYQYTGLFRSTSDAASDAMTRFGQGAVVAMRLDRAREVKA